MLIEDVQKLPHGVYKIYWNSGGSSLATVGSLHDGTRWMAPTNWVTIPQDKNVINSYWNEVTHVELLLHHSCDEW